ncbi:MAG: hypothetical protein HN348_14115 [Proteobacteria bacterium]|nr:hypothetical protein [Pseudomonadota bacterium]
MLTQAIAIVLGTLFGLAVAGKGYQFLIRWQALRRIPVSERVRVAKGLSIRVLIHGARNFAGMNPRKLNRTKGDMVLGKDHFLIVSSRGVLADLRPDRGRRFTSIRCTGPHRLVIEGDSPRTDGQMGLYRFELVIDDASGWAEALQPWVRSGESNKLFAVKPPT